MNQLTISGHLGRDPEIRDANGNMVCDVSLAVKEYRKDGGTTWIRLVAWNKQADFLGAYGRKGSYVVATGRLQVREYEHDGETRTSVECVAFSVEIPRMGDGGGRRDDRPPKTDKPSGGGFGDDEIPF